MLNKRFFLFLMALNTAILFISCSKKDDPGPVEPVKEVKIADNVRILNDSLLSGMTALDTTTFDLNFTTWPVGVSAPKVGEIMVGGVSESTPYGVMRRIATVNTAGSGYNCTTIPAKLDEVILQGKIDLQHVKMSPAKVKSIHLQQGIKIIKSKNSNLLGFDFSFEKELGTPNVKAYGSLYFEVGFNFGLDISLDPPRTDFNASIEIIQSAIIGLRAQGNWSGQSINIAEIVFTPWTIMVGPVPVVFVPKAVLVLKADAGIGASIETYATESFNRELGLRCVLKPLSSPDWTLINQWEPAPTFDYLWPSLQGDASFTVKCGPEVSLKLYGQAGPYFNLFVKSSLNASLVSGSSTNFNMDFCLGLEANAGVQVSLLGFWEFDKYVNLFDKDIKCWNLNNEPIPKGIRISSPANNSSAVIGTTIPVSMVVNGMPASGVKIYIDNVLKTTLTLSPYTWNWTVNETEGQHTIKAEATIAGEEMVHSIVVNVGLATWREPAITGFKTDETINSLYFYDKNNGFAVGYGDVYFGNKWGFILNTSDGGKTWGRRKEIADDFGGFTDVLMSGPNHGYACGDNLGLYGTLDGGANWEPMKDIYGEYIQASIIRITSNVVIVKANGIDVGVSTDGINFLESYNNQVTIEPAILAGTSQPKIVDMAFGSGGIGFFAGTSIGSSWIYKTTDNGMSWNQVTAPGTSGFQINSIEVFENALVWVSGKSLNDGSEIYWSNNGCNTWNKAQIPDYYSGALYDIYTIKDISFVDPNTGYAVGTFGTQLSGSSILQSVDGGKNWNVANISFQKPKYEMKKVFFVNKYCGFTGGYSNSDFNNDNAKKASLFRYGVD